MSVCGASRIHFEYFLHFTCGKKDEFLPIDIWALVTLTHTYFTWCIPVVVSICTNFITSCDSIQTHAHVPRTTARHSTMKKKWQLFVSMWKKKAAKPSQTQRISFYCIFIPQDRESEREGEGGRRRERERVHNMSFIRIIGFIYFVSFYSGSQMEWICRLLRRNRILNRQLIEKLELCIDQQQTSMASGLIRRHIRDGETLSTTKKKKGWKFPTNESRCGRLSSIHISNE